MVATAVNKGWKHLRQHRVLVCLLLLPRVICRLLPSKLLGRGALGQGAVTAVATPSSRKMPGQEASRRLAGG